MQDITNRLQSLLANFLSSEVIASPESGTVNDTVSLQLSPGQRVQAQVEATLANGSFKVSIANQSLQVLLPRNTQLGDVLDLIFVSNQPRPTFLLAESSVRPQENVSNAGRFISSLLPQATKSSSPLIIESATQIL